MKRTARAMIPVAILVCLSSPILVTASQLNPQLNLSDADLTVDSNLYNNGGLGQNLDPLPSDNDLTPLNPSLPQNLLPNNTLAQ